MAIDQTFRLRRGGGGGGGGGRWSCGIRGAVTEGPVGDLRKFSPPWLSWSDKESSSRAEPIGIGLVRSATAIYGRGEGGASGLAATYVILIRGRGAFGCSVPRGRLCRGGLYRG